MTKKIIIPAIMETGKALPVGAKKSTAGVWGKIPGLCEMFAEAEPVLRFETDVCRNKTVTIEISLYAVQGFQEMNKRNIALIGFRTTGKSLTGKVLAARLERVFVDMDHELVASFGQDIDAWVRSHGWESFRKAESALLETLSSQQNLVVATGGGVILDERNRKALREKFCVIWLKAASQTVYSRLIKDPKTPSSRPPLTELPMKEEIERLLQDRSPLYAEASDLALDTDQGSVANLVLRIQEWLAEQSEPEAPGPSSRF